jgi:hypothetical protein
MWLENRLMNGTEVQTVTQLITIERVTVVGLLLGFIAGLKFEWWYMSSHVRALKETIEDQRALIYAMYGVTERSVDSAKVVVLGQTGRKRKQNQES